MTRATKEKADSSHADAQPGRRSRRQAITLAGVAAAAATVAVLGMERDNKARAATDDPMVVGRHNEANPGDATALDATVEGASALRVVNPGGPGSTAIHGDGPNGATGLRGTSASTGPGVHGTATEGAGVLGESDSGTGVEGRSQSGPGVNGNSEGGPGVAGGGNGWAGVHGLCWGGPGVVGETFGAGPGVEGNAPGEMPGVRANSASPDGPRDGGLALEVNGKAHFSTGGAAAVPARMSAATVANPAVTAHSHITVTFTADPGRVALAWVERQPGTGFVVHLSGSPRWDVPFTYLILETNTV